jgi:glucose-1-phosphate thymidylyltransferase
MSKHLMPVFDKPMIYYPLSTLVSAGIRDILVITTPQDQEQFRRLLGDGSQWGLSLRYVTQPRPRGIAEAFLLADDFLAGGPATLILGDNLFDGAAFGVRLRESLEPVGARIFACPADDPTQFAVACFDDRGRVLSIEEKPARPKSRYVVPGIYCYDGDVVKIARGVRPSHRGELEITAVNEEYLRRGELSVRLLDEGTVWIDTGTFRDLNRAAEYVRIIEQHQGVKIGCIEEAAWRAGFLDDAALRALAIPLTPSGYGTYLLDVLERKAEVTR